MSYMANIIFPGQGMRYPLLFRNLSYDIPNQRDITPMAFSQHICFAPGSFDDFCAWTRLDYNGNTYYAKPPDTYYFELASQLGQAYSNSIIYSLIRQLYDAIPIRPSDNSLIPAVTPDLIQLIHTLANSLPDISANRGWCLNMLFHLCYGMIAEENKKNTYLGKSIKLTGVYGLLFDGKSIDQAANENRGRTVSQIIQQQHEYNIDYPVAHRPIPVAINSMAQF